MTSPPETAFRDAGQLIFAGRSFSSYEAAKLAGLTLKNAIRLAAVDVGKAIDVGRERWRTTPGQVMIDQMAQSGILLLPDVHGLLVYEETGEPRVLLVQANIMVSVPLESFTEALRSRTPEAATVSDKQVLACDLFAQSRFELSGGGRHLTLCTALEVLADRQERTGRAAELVEAFRQSIKTALEESSDELERTQLQSLLGGATDLRSESITAAIRRLAASVPPAEVGNTDPETLAKVGYGVRSQLIHTGTTEHDLAKLHPLTELVRYLCRRPPADRG